MFWASRTYFWRTCHHGDRPTGPDFGVTLKQYGGRREPEGVMARETEGESTKTRKEEVDEKARWRAKSPPGGSASEKRGPIAVQYCTEYWRSA